MVMLVLSFKFFLKSIWQKPLFYFFSLFREFAAICFWVAFWRNFAKKKHWVEDER
jgi:hypothetical protein